MEGSLAGEIIYEIINYSKKGIIHNYKGLNIHIQRVFRERPENLSLISKELTDRAVRELISSGVLYKTKKESFCITQKGNEYAKNSTKSDIIEEYSNFSLTGALKPVPEFPEASADNPVEALNIPDKNNFSGSKPYSDIINRFSTFKVAEPASGPEIYGSKNKNTYYEIISRFNTEDKPEAVAAKEDCIGEVYLIGSSEEIRNITDKEEESGYIPVKSCAEGRTDTDKNSEERAGSEISGSTVPVKENSEEEISGTSEEETGTETENYTAGRPEAAPAGTKESKSPGKNHFSDSEAYRDIINRFCPAKEAGQAPETKTEMERKRETKRKTEAEPAPEKETEAGTETEKFLFGNFSPKRDTINGFKPGTGDEAAALEVNHAVEDLTGEASAGDNQEGDDLKIVLSGGSLDTDELLLKLNSEDEEILKRSLAMLGEKGDASVAPEIEKFLNNKSYEIFEAAFEALTKIRNENRQ
ncbi:HEAT repeat domain-containing protein [Methanoplanus limicola]|uniref:Uncharacterized protein n=1 Tax=Methanoplanus limicola DSM 2279 TaxID=937775 RepID=H1YZF8_9EURY|nr:HEAT repeat domain-containing protein [Methanoplanus limicola]EHQ36067.1 hypothetical protein Metlim_1978 [Methanoplanus limicola DSM 2279]